MIQINEGVPKEWLNDLLIAAAELMRFKKHYFEEIYLHAKYDGTKISHWRDCMFGCDIFMSWFFLTLDTMVDLC